MSWIEKIESELNITTGDGKVFTFLWRNAVKVKDYNVKEFNFIETPGTFVDRREPKGSRFDLELYFTGDDHLDLAEEFEESADDKRAWTINHPFYGLKIIHPLSISRDNRQYNVSLFKIIVIETLTTDNPKTVLDPVDKIVSDNDALNDVFAETAAAEIIYTTDINNTMLDYNNTLFDDATDQIENAEDKDTYLNLFNEANAAVINATEAPLNAMRAVQTFINYPFLLQESIENRFNMLVSQFTLLRKKITTLTTPSSKRLYENYSGTILSSLSVAISTPFGVNDYTSGLFVISLIDSLTDNYDQYITDLDSFSTISGGTPQSYIANPDSMIELNNLVNFVASNLFNVALNGKRERNFFLENDSNVILLTHRLLGISDDEAELAEFIRDNNIGLSEILVIKKGRLITYFI